MKNGEVPRPSLIIGGAGFIGCNLADRIARSGRRVRVYDNLSRRGARDNLDWLRETHGERIELLVADVRDREALEAAVADADSVFHLAARVAVTTSLEDPLEDFDVNLRGTVLLLEALRTLDRPPPLLVASTNKVYGCLGDLPLVEEDRRWSPAAPGVAALGINEERPLDFRTPYGCSKGAADQYVLDYAESFGLPAVVFRMSCIYGPRQLGTEDQGWVAHFMVRAIDNRPITIFGDGKQVRDVLYIDDLVDAFHQARDNIDDIAGRAFNIGGGPSSTLSLLELLDMIERVRGRRPVVELRDWRSGDQRYYVSDTRAFFEATGWRPRVPVYDGLRRLHDWLGERRWSQPIEPIYGSEAIR